MTTTITTVSTPRKSPVEILRANRQQALVLSQKIGVDKLRHILEKAQRSLNHRLAQAEGLAGATEGTYTEVHRRVALVQIQQVLRDVQAGIKSTLTGEAPDAATEAAKGTLQYLNAAEKRFRWSVERLPLNEAALLLRSVSGTNSSLLHRLEGDPKKGPGILRRYGTGVTERFEEVLQQRFLAKTSWADTRKALTAESPFLQGAPGHWAERIVRTELMGVHNQSSLIATMGAQEELGDVVKILSCVFDDRTGADSIAVHGQIRRPSEPFDTWYGPVQHPPDRPNDRAVVVTHRISWPIPPELAPRGDGEVEARWSRDGNKQTHPPRPLMTTVARDLFGKAQVASGRAAAPGAAQAPAMPTPTYAPRAAPREPIAAPEPAAEPLEWTKVVGGYKSNEGTVLRRTGPKREWQLEREGKTVVLGKRATFDHAEGVLQQLKGELRQAAAPKPPTAKPTPKSLLQKPTRKVASREVGPPQAKPKAPPVAVAPTWTPLPGGGYAHPNGARLLRPEPKGDWYLHYGAHRVKLGKRATFDHAEGAMGRIQAMRMP